MTTSRARSRDIACTECRDRCAFGRPASTAGRRDASRLHRAGRRRAKQQTVDDAEHRRVRADAESERENDRDGEPRLCLEPARGVAKVLRENVDQREAARVARVVLDAIESAEAEPRAPFGLVARNAGRDVLLDFALDVKAQLIVQLALDGGPLEERAHAKAQVAQDLAQHCISLGLRLPRE